MLAASPALDWLLASRGLPRWEWEKSSSSPGTEALRNFLLPLFALLFCGGFLVFLLRAAELSLAQQLGGAFSWALIGGIPGLIAGHALIHGNSQEGRKLGQALFVAMNYPHFPHAHLHVHHRHVASAKDFHSAPKGTHYYRFLLSGLVREAQLMGRELKNSKTRQKHLPQEIARALLLAAIALYGGFGLLALYLATTFLMRAIVWLVNYVQHYGLAAGEDHSWDVGHRSTNLLFFNAGLHRDHHEHASRAPLRLKLTSAKVFPVNFPGILLLALFPRAFFRKMDPLL